MLCRSASARAHYARERPTQTESCRPAALRFTRKIVACILRDYHRGITRPGQCETGVTQLARRDASRRLLDGRRHRCTLTVGVADSSPLFDSVCTLPVPDELDW